MTRLTRFLRLVLSGHHRWSRCWLGCHRWSWPGGYCERCGRCDKFFHPHPFCTGRTCAIYEFERRPPTE